MIGAASGAVRISAGAGVGGVASAGDLDIVGSRIAALNAITLGGDTVDIVNNVNVNTTATTNTSSQFGLTIAVQAPLINSVASLARLGDIATKTSNSRTLAVSALAAGLAIKNGYDAAKTAIDAIKSGNGAIGANVSATLGYSRSTSTSLSIDQTIVASQVTGGDVSILARAGANRTGISIYGSDIAASRDVRLFSNGAIDLGAAIETDRYSGQSSSFTASIGVSAGVDYKDKKFSLGSATITASLSSSNSRYNGVDVTARSTIVGAGGTASVNTLGLLTIDGSQLSANRVEIDAGALNIVSRQNTSNYLSRERSFGVSLAYTFGASANGGFSGSLNVGGGNQTGNFASVADQAGIRAGSDGFDIRVAGLTDLKGGVIASTAAAGLNALRTGTFRASNINNVESYNVNSYSFGVGTGSVFLNGTGGVNNTGGSLLPSFLGLSFTLPTYLTAYGSQSSTTLSAISPASVVIASGEALSLSALASLSRDTTNANSALTRQFTEARRADIAQDFEAARQLVTEVSTFFANRAAEQTRAEASAIAAGVEYEINPATGQPKLDASGKPIPRRDLITGNLIAAPNSGAQQYIDIASNARKNYGSGSAARLIGTAISGAAGGNVTGSLGSFVQAAAVNALQSLAVRQVKDIADSFFKQDPNYPNNPNARIPTVESEAVRTALQALVGCAGAAPTGNCASGALGASSSVVLNNLITSLLQPEARDAAGNIIPRSLADQQTRTALIATLTGAIAGALGANAGVASNAGVIETENNAILNRDGTRTRNGLRSTHYSIEQLSRDNASLRNALSGARRAGESDQAVIDRYNAYVTCGQSAQSTCARDSALDALASAFSGAISTENNFRKNQLDFLAGNNQELRAAFSRLTREELAFAERFERRLRALPPTERALYLADQGREQTVIGSVLGAAVRRVFTDDQIVDAYLSTLRGRALVNGSVDTTAEALTPIARFLGDTALVASEFDPQTGIRNPLFDSPAGQALLTAARTRNSAVISGLVTAAGNTTIEFAQLAADLAPPPWVTILPDGSSISRAPLPGEQIAFATRSARGRANAARIVEGTYNSIVDPLINAYSVCVNGSDAYQCGRATPGAALSITGVAAVVRRTAVRVFSRGVPSIANPLGFGADFLALNPNIQTIINSIARPGDGLSIGDGVAPGTRLAQDVAVSPSVPDLLSRDRPVGSLQAQNDAAQADLATLRSLGVPDARVNQQQLSGGCRVGICRPDVQGTLPDGRKIYIEYDRSSSNRGAAHANRLRRNDPNAIVILRTVG